MKHLDLLKKYLPSLLYTVLFLVIGFALYKLITRLRAGGLAIGGILADKAENSTISNNTGVPTARVQQLRNVARDVSIELETSKDQSWWDKTKHVQLDADTIDIMQNVKNANEMVIVSNFYSEIFTNNRRLKDDLIDVLSSSDQSKIPYFSALQ